MDEELEIIFPVQCSCGHIMWENYRFNEVTNEGYIGFSWCGFCRKKHMVKPYNNHLRKEGNCEKNK